MTGQNVELMDQPPHRPDWANDDFTLFSSPDDTVFKNQALEVSQIEVEQQTQMMVVQAKQSEYRYAKK